MDSQKWVGIIKDVRMVGGGRGKEAITDVLYLFPCIWRNYTHPECPADIPIDQNTLQTSKCIQM